MYGWLQIIGAGEYLNIYIYIYIFTKMILFWIRYRFTLIWLNVLFSRVKFGQKSK
jgi:hypothetical protein